MATPDWPWQSSTIKAACDKCLHFSAIISPPQSSDPRNEQQEDVDKPELQGRTDSLDCERHYIGNLLQESKEESFCNETPTAAINEDSPKQVPKKQKKLSQKRIMYNALLPTNLQFEPPTPLQLAKVNEPQQENAQEMNYYKRVNDGFPLISDHYLPGQKFTQMLRNNIYSGKTYSAVAQQPRLESWNAGDNQLEFQRFFNKPGSPSSNSSSSHSSANSVSTFGGHWSVGQTSKSKKYTSQSNLPASAGVETVPPNSVKIPGLNPVNRPDVRPKLSNEPKTLGKKQRSVGDFQQQISANNRKKKTTTTNTANNGIKDCIKHGSFSNFSNAFHYLSTKNNSSFIIYPPFTQSEPTSSLQKQTESNNHLSNEKEAKPENFDLQITPPHKVLHKTGQKSRFEVLGSISRPVLKSGEKEQFHQRRSQSVNCGLTAPKQAIKEKRKLIAHPLIDLSSAGKPNVRRDLLEETSLATLTKNGLMLMLSNFMLFLASAFGSAQSGRRPSNNYASVAAGGRRRNNGKITRKNISQTSPALQFLCMTCSTLWKALRMSGNWIVNLFFNFFLLLFRAAADGSKFGFQNILLLLYRCRTKIYLIGRKLVVECLHVHREINDQIQHLRERAMRKLMPGEEKAKSQHVAAVNSKVDSNMTESSSKSSFTWPMRGELEDGLSHQQRSLDCKGKSIRKNLNKKAVKQEK